MSPTMRIRLIHTQSLLLITTVLVTVLSMGALNAWNLRNGFVEFLAAQEIVRLEQFAKLVSQNAEKAGSIETLNARKLGMHDLFLQFGLITEGSQPPPLDTRPLSTLPLHPPPPHMPPHLPPHPDAMERLPGDMLEVPQHPPPPENNSQTFKARVSVYDLNRQLLMGKALTNDPDRYVERAVRVRGETVAMVRMEKLIPVPDAEENRFLSSQYTSMAIVAGLLLLFALLLAFWLAGRLVKPLLQIQAATERIAKGDFEVRMNHSRTDEIGDTIHNINLMAISLQKLEGARRRWIADMSHELRTPLTVLRGEIDAIIDGVLPLNPAAIMSLKEEVSQLNALVDDLHLLAMSDLKALPCYFEEFDLVALAEKIVLRFTPRATQLGLTLKLRPAEPQLWVHWDTKRIEQMLSNLLDNSLRYTDAPGFINMSLKTNAQQVLIEIEDSSPAISKNDMPHIFEPLYRADSARQRVSGGSGLGLAICQAIVVSHQGSIRAKASDLGGLLIQLTLPVDPIATESTT